MINTWSKFNYGTSVTAQNYMLDIQEAGSPLVASIVVKPYTLGEVMTAVQTALNEAGGLTYTVSLNRSTGLVTIAATGTFKLLLATGANISTSFWSELGFTQTTDLTGATTYTGITPAGTQYYPQFLLQSYVDPTHYQQSLEPVINRTASGRTEVVRYGVEEFIEFEIKFITNKPMDGVVIKNNPTGLTDAILFLQDLINKSRFEFVPDVASASVFHKVILESSPGYKDGTGFKLKELFAQDLPDIFETGILTLRVVS